MKLKSLSCAVLLPLGLIATASAQAANYMEIDGDNVQFFYDADFWGENAATVTGNTISFDLGTDYTTSAKVKTSGANSLASQTLQQSDPFGLVVVAKGGYQLQNYLEASLVGHYTLAAQGGYAVGSAAGFVNSGTFTGGTFNPAPWSGDYYSAYNIVFSSGAVSSGALNTSGTAGALGVVVPGLGIETFVASGVQQAGPGSSTSVVSSVSYGVAVVAAPVPEPEAYAMLLAGLGALALAARRRKGGM